MRQSSLFLGFILLYFVALGLAYAQAVPIFEASDEAEHVIHIHTILERGELPVIQSSDDMNRQTDPIARWNNQAHHAPLYYLLGTATISWSQRDDLGDYLIPNELIFLRNTTENNANKWLHLYSDPTSDTHQAVFALRLLSIAIGCGTLLLVFWSARQIFDDDLWPLLATLFTASIPTFIVVNSSASNDPLTIFLYTAGIGWSLKVWRQATISWRDTWLISLILSGIALTKLTGVSLFGVVYAVLIFGVLRQKWSLSLMIRIVLVSGVMASVLAGWWYLRNMQIYGDLLAQTATQSIWGRSDPLTLALLPDELLRIGKSFWMMVGYLHEPVFAPNTFYIFASVVTVLGILGILYTLFRSPKTDSIDRIPTSEILILGFACIVVIGLLLYGTLSVDISYGRLLHPAIAPFVILLLIGWRQFLGRFGALLILPFVGLAIAAPLTIIPQAYPRLELVESVPADAHQIEWQADSLELVALDLHQTQVEPSQILSLDLYFRGNHPDNPALLVTAADSLRATRLGHVEIYPGMAATNFLAADQLYRVPVHIALDDVPDDVRQPRYVAVLVEWVNLEDNEKIVFDSDQSLYEIMQTTFVDPRYDAPQLANESQAVFGDLIALESYQVNDEAGTLTVEFVWQPLHPIADEWILTVQAFDETGVFITQIDEIPYWYPTSAWVENLAFYDRRTLVLPDNITDYTLRVGWYRQRDDGAFERLPIVGAESVDGLLGINEGD